jgi:hypothetical protein
VPAFGASRVTAREQRIGPLRLNTVSRALRSRKEFLSGAAMWDCELSRWKVVTKGLPRRVSHIELVTAAPVEGSVVFGSGDWD